MSDKKNLFYLYQIHTGLTKGRMGNYPPFSEIKHEHSCLSSLYLIFPTNYSDEGHARAISASESVYA
jgi:hypothetical protein